MVAGAADKGKSGKDLAVTEAGKISMDEQVADAFWRFSVELYAKPGVEPALLTLQDVHGLEVNLVLFCLFAGISGHRFDEAAIATMRERARIWGRGVVGPLRAARRGLKPLLPTHAAAGPLRAEVKRLELMAERAMQTALVDLLDGPDEGAAGRQLAGANLTAYIEAEGHMGETGMFGVLLDAAFTREA
jgi:uncharacterized protein (TIGR02444 family)